MELNKLILGLAINTRDAIDFLKVKKDRHLSRKLHGAKRNLIRVLQDHFNLIECQRVLQFTPNMQQQKKCCSECGTVKPVFNGYCLIKFSFDVMGQNINFHVPQEDADFSINYKLTTKKVRVLNGKIPASQISSYTTFEQIEDVIKLLNNLPNLKQHNNTSKIFTEPPRDRYIQRLKTYLFEVSPLKLSL